MLSRLFGSSPDSVVESFVLDAWHALLTIFKYSFSVCTHTIGRDEMYVMYLSTEPIDTCLFTGTCLKVCTILPQVPSWLREPLTNPITPDSVKYTALKRKQHGYHSEQRRRCAHQIRRPKTPSQPNLLSLPPILHLRLGDRHRRRRLDQARRPHLSRALRRGKRADAAGQYLRHAVCEQRVHPSATGRFFTNGGVIPRRALPDSVEQSENMKAPSADGKGRLSNPLRALLFSLQLSPRATLAAAFTRTPSGLSS